MDQTQALKKIQQIIFDHLFNYEYEVFLFGSRASGESHHKYANFDIGIKSNNEIPFNIYSKIITQFEDSNIPYIIDLVDFNAVSDDFRQVAMQHTITLNN